MQTILSPVERLDPSSTSHFNAENSFSNLDVMNCDVEDISEKSLTLPNSWNSSLLTPAVTISSYQDATKQSSDLQMNLYDQKLSSISGACSKLELFVPMTSQKKGMAGSNIEVDAISCSSDGQLTTDFVDRCYVVSAVEAGAQFWQEDMCRDSGTSFQKKENGKLSRKKKKRKMAGGVDQIENNGNSGVSLSRVKNKKLKSPKKLVTELDNSSDTRVLKKKRRNKMKKSPVGAEKEAKKARKKAIKKSRFERKNIRKIMEAIHLDQQAQLAQKEEEERMQRLQELRLAEQEFLVMGTTDQAIKQELLTENEIACVPEVSKATVSATEMNEKCSVNIEQTCDQVQQAISADDVVEISDGESDNDVVLVKHPNSFVREEPEDENGLIDSFNCPDQYGRVLVNVGHPLTEPDIFLHQRLASSVKRHQIGGIRFMYDNLIESLDRFRSCEGFGCILAHSMGLGKTLQVISFVDVVLRWVDGARSVMIIVPVNTLQNWVSEFNKWLPAEVGEVASSDQTSSTAVTQSRQFRVYVINENMKTNVARATVVENWFDSGGVLLLGYEMYRLLTSAQLGMKRRRNGKTNKSLNQEIIDVDLEDSCQELTKKLHKALIRPGPDMVICDEGHRIKNCAAGISRALKNIRTKRRLVLTGYPLQNNLIEYWCMVDFVRPNYLGSRQDFSNMFERPIMNGQCKDSTRDDVRLMRERSHVLHNKLKGFVQRRGHSVLKSSLPDKEEYVILLKLSPIQRSLYREFIMQIKTSGIGAWGSSNNPIKAFSVCCKIWNHPDILYQFVGNSKDDSDLDVDDPFLKVADTADISSTASCIKRKVNRCTRGKTDADCEFRAHVGDIQGKAKTVSYDWATELMHGYVTGMINNSGKMVVLMSIIDACVRKGEKILVFSQSILTLNLIEEFLKCQFVPETNANWTKAKHYLRIDGSTSALERERLVNLFNCADSKQLHLFLLSTRAGCLGINLVSASRVVVFDASWNPCLDCQAVCRVYRYGQSRRCFIYRLVADNTMEHCIYDRQISKQGISDRIVDEMNPQNLLSRRQIEELLRFQDEEPPLIDTNGCEQLFSDDVLVNVLKNHGSWITKMPFAHDSLLFDCEDQKLTVHEKIIAEQNFERDQKFGGKVTERSAFHSAVADVEQSDPMSFGYFSADSKSESASMNQYLPAVDDYFKNASPQNAASESDDVIITGTSYRSKFDYLPGNSTFSGFAPQANGISSGLNFGYDNHGTSEPLDLTVDNYRFAKSNQFLDGQGYDTAQTFSSADGHYSSNMPLISSTEPTFDADSVPGPSTREVNNSLQLHDHNALMSGRVLHVKPGVSVQMIQLDRDITVPRSNGDPSSAYQILRAGERIHVIRTPKGLYIRTPQGKVYAVHQGMINSNNSCTAPIDQSPFVSTGDWMTRGHSSMPLTSTGLQPPSYSDFIATSSLASENSRMLPGNQYSAPFISTCQPNGASSYTNELSFNGISNNACRPYALDADCLLYGSQRPDCPPDLTVDHSTVNNSVPNALGDDFDAFGDVGEFNVNNGDESFSNFDDFDVNADLFVDNNKCLETSGTSSRVDNFLSDYKQRNPFFDPCTNNAAQLSSFCPELFGSTSSSSSSTAAAAVAATTTAATAAAATAAAEGWNDFGDYLF